MLPETLEVRYLLSGVCDTIPTLPSLVSVSGRQVIVEERLPDESLGGPAALVAKGVNWSPHSIGAAQANLHKEFHQWFQTDIPLMREMGVNVVRVYHDFGTDANAFQILDALYLAGIKVIVSVDSPRDGVSADLNNISTVVNAYKNHPAVLMWNVGVEWDVNGYYGNFGTLAEAAQFTESSAQLIKSLDTNHPVTTAIADPHIQKDYSRPQSWYHPLSQAAFPEADHEHGYMDEIVNSVPSVDVWSVQIYRASSFQDVFQQWESISAEPVLVSEFGADAFDHRVDAVNQAMQSDVDAGLWDELHFNLSAYRSAGVAVGGLVFSWQDEWWKNGTPGVHTVSTEGNGGQLDGFNDEEYFGVTDINRQPREAYAALQDRFLNGESQIVVNALPLLRATSQSGSRSARFEIDGKVVFQRAGGSQGARGINVGVLDLNTGIRLSEVRSFDTWKASGGWGGAHDNFQLLINYLNSLPNGAVIALAIADEGGFINPNAEPDQPWQDSNVESAYAALEALGSTQIRSVGYNGGWAMIAVKGLGVLAEESSNAGEPVSIEHQVTLNLNLDAGKCPNLNSPVVATLVSRQLYAGTTLCLQVSASDADRDSLRFSLDSAPSGAIIDGTRGVFSWVTAASQTPGMYNVTVRATDSGTPGRSDTESFTITVYGSPTITNPSTVTALQRPTIAWSSVPGATGYEVWVTKDPGTNPYHQVTVSKTSYTPPVDFGIGKFNLWVRAKKNVSFGPWTPKYSFVINTPAAMHSIARSQPTLRPTIGWDVLPGAVKYDVWFNDVSRGINQYIRNVTVTGTAFTPSSDMPMGLYRAWVRGIAADGTFGNWSGGIDFQTMQAPVITAPLNSTFDRRPVFTWNAIAGATSYELQIKNTKTNTITYYPKGLTATNWTPPANLPDGPYRWWIIAIGPNNLRGFWTAPVDIHIGGQTGLVTPTGSTTDTTPTFAWKPVDGAARYELWVTSVALNVRVVNQTNLTTLNYTPTTALAKGIYRAWVRAVSASGEVGIWSAQTDFVIAETESGTDSSVASLSRDSVLLTVLPEIERVLYCKSEESNHEQAARPDASERYIVADEGRLIVDLVDADGTNVVEDFIRQSQSRQNRCVALHQQASHSESMLDAVMSQFNEFGIE